MIIKGKVWKFGNDINTDVIFPGKYTYSIKDPKEMAEHAMEDADPDFAKNVEEGDVIIAGTNFGCGSSRQQAVTAIKYAGVGAVIAKSFARIYYRNAINLGLLAVMHDEIADIAENGEPIEIDTDKGEISLKGQIFKYPPFPEYITKIMDAGGLIPLVKEQLGKV
jgi:3-isopropylmalate/(R)-2-methylmalate dehydratase small subunit